MKRVIFSGTGLLLLAIAFVVFNSFSSLTLSGARLDLTEQKLFTISDGTREILASLDEPVNLHFFYSNKAAKDLVSLRNYASRVEELLRAYERAADGKLRLSVVDPEPFSEAEDKAASFGLQGVPLNANGDTLYFGLAGTNALDDVQTIPFFPLDQEEFLEYQLSQLIQGLAKPEKPSVGLISSLPVNGGYDMMSRQPTQPWMVLEEMRQLFEIKSLKAGVDQIPQEIGVLLLIHPKQLPDATLYAIDQFVLRGGKLLVFVDPFAEGEQANDFTDAMSNDKASDLAALFKAWGVAYDSSKVLADARYAMSVNLGQGQQPVRHVGWVNLDSDSLDADDVVSAGLDNLAFATSGFVGAAEGATTQLTPLVQSSDMAMPMASNRFAVLRNPEELFREMEPTGERYALAARVTGPAKTAFPEGIEGQKDGLKQADNINLIVVADTDMLSDRMWVQVQEFFGQRVPQPFASNANFVINALDNLSGSEALISVRSRGRFSRPFTVVESLQRQAETRLQDKEQVLQQRLSETEQKLASLQQSDDPSKVFELSPEQQATVQQFLNEKIQLRKELREVRFQLNAEIEQLAGTLKFINIGLIPLILTVLVLLALLLRRRRHA
ncbi:GldG family protein [Atopomonas sediminilitoris]|uniref:GldG family protein n=1 Tax=Atopomonas sediminilitoris TaxID=2919919 RepID=UPI001F4EA548|nr:Gldg family protein [Atopomonas sediminilitoris]MCJ8168857.1 Gldg family protein [Atopomonas sediminilitoris]